MGFFGAIGKALGGAAKGAASGLASGDKGAAISGALDGALSGGGGGGSVSKGSTGGNIFASTRTPVGNDLPEQGGITGTLGRGTNIKDAMMSRFASPSEKAPSARASVNRSVKRPVSRALGRR